MALILSFISFLLFEICRVYADIAFFFSPAVVLLSEIFPISKE